ncbi:MAG: AAA family ATPase [Planctomycetes bacterium]|nr:AAA family ATPase [Planctomycetota bacterium]
MEKYDKDGNTAKEKAFQLEGIVQRVEPKVSWEDLTLPQAKLSQLKEICKQAREIHRTFRECEFDRRLSHGKGLKVLFSGPPGSSKTMAVEVIASDLEMPLYRIDLSAVVSKYIGETEKNLTKIFDSAESFNAILFFDEADALFGKRSEVKDSHDRYANIEINYLLQRMEEYTGIAVLATNLLQSLDKAFIRRMQFVVEFDFPENERREKLWDMVWRWFRRILKKA